MPTGPRQVVSFSGLVPGNLLYPVGCPGRASTDRMSPRRGSCKRTRLPRPKVAEDQPVSTSKAISERRGYRREQMPSHDWRISRVVSVNGHELRPAVGNGLLEIVEYRNGTPGTSEIGNTLARFPFAIGTFPSLYFLNPSFHV